ncbi:MAG: DUF308 domain-containing protein [Lachnospiraceae bacterium]|nr:DUF308 domain-containing protein [Lachnospiraceae bacterium]
MVVLSIILGLLMIFTGISLMCTPVKTFLQSGYFLGIMLFVYGFAGVLKAFRKQSTVFETISSVLALILGVLAMCFPGVVLQLDGMILYMTAFWFVLRGVFAIVLGFSSKSVNKSWIFGVIVGVLSLLLGFYSFAHPLVPVITVGILLGLYFVETGIDMIVFSTVVKKAVDKAEEARE